MASYIKQDTSDQNFDGFKVSDVEHEIILKYYWEMKGRRVMKR
jgi:hypothetical protein